MSEVLKNLLHEGKITPQQYIDVMYAREQENNVAAYIEQNEQPDDKDKLLDQLNKSNALLVIDNHSDEDTPKATLVLGGPGSGKSTIINQLNELSIESGGSSYGSLIDSDEYKKDVMEFYGLDRDHVGKGGSHALCDTIVRYELKQAAYSGQSFIHPLVGKTREKIQNMVTELDEIDGYEVSLIMLEVSPEHSALSTINRLTSERDEYGDPAGQFVDPEYAYEATASLDGAYEFYVNELKDHLHGHALIDNNDYQQLVIESTNIQGIPDCVKKCHHNNMIQSERNAYDSRDYEQDLELSL